MTALVTSDWHLTDDPRDAYRHDWVKGELVRLVQKHKPDELLMLGDLTEHKGGHSAELVNQIAGYLYVLSQHCNVYVMRGNHDGYTADRSFFEFVKFIPRIKFFDRPNADVLSIGNCCFLPHTRNHKEDWEAVSLAPFQRDWRTGFIFAHNTFHGAFLGHETTAKGIPLDVFPKKAMVISGDVHVPQDLPPVTYVGAPYTVYFGDEYRPRVLLLQRKNGVPGITESIKCTGPQKRVLQINKTGKVPEIEMDHPFQNLFINKGDMVKVRINWEDRDIAKFPEFRESVHKWGEKNGYLIRGVEAIVDQPTSSSKKFTVQAQGSDLTVFGRYCSRNKIDVPRQKTGERIIEGK